MLIWPMLAGTGFSVIQNSGHAACGAVGVGGHVEDDRAGAAGEVERLLRVRRQAAPRRRRR